MKKYLKEYHWSNIFAMLRNLKSVPEVCTEDFKNRRVVITGATSGIGLATAHRYAAHGADIVCINRNAEKSKEVCAELTHRYHVNCQYLLADFSRLADVHRAGEQLAALEGTIDVLIHNAGVFMTQKTFTTDNLEMVFQTNYLSTFILNMYVKEKLRRQKSGRILYVNSEAHRFAVWGIYLDDLDWKKHAYSGLRSYGAAKMAQLLSLISWSNSFAGSGVTVNAMHPGNVKTNSGQNNGTLYKLSKKIFVDRAANTPDISATALYYLGVSPALQGVSGKFFHLTTEEEPAPPALDKNAADELWQLSLALGGLT